MKFSCAVGTLLVLSGSPFVADATSTKLRSMPSLQSALKPSSDSALMPSEQIVSMRSLQEVPCTDVLFSTTTEIQTVEEIEDILLFPLTDLPVAVSNVDLRVFLKGDVDATEEFYYLEGENIAIGKPGRAAGLHRACGDFVQEDFVMDISLFNFVVQDGNFELQMRPFRNNTDPSECPGADSDQAFIELSYTYCGVVTPEPSSLPSKAPTLKPSSMPSSVPPPLKTSQPTSVPTIKPSTTPSVKASSMPSAQPSSTPLCPLLPFFFKTDFGTVVNIEDILLFPLTDLPEAATDIDFSVYLKGDLGANEEFYYLEGENIVIGKPGRATGIHNDCGEFVQEDFVMNVATFNFVASDGNFAMQMRPFRNNTDPSTCPGLDSDQAYVELSYRYCDTGSSAPSAPTTTRPSSMPSIVLPTENPSETPTLSSVQPSSMPSRCPMALYNVTTDTQTVQSTSDILFFPLTELPVAVTDVEFQVFLKGDLNANEEFYTLEGENIVIGKPGRDPGVHDECGSFVKEEMVMSLELFNLVAADGEFDLQMTPFRDNIDPNLCDGSDSDQAFIQISYMYCVEGSSTPSSNPSTNASAEPSSAPSTSAPTLASSKPSVSSAPSVSSIMPSCPITSVDVDSSEMSKEVVTCPPTILSGSCEQISYNFPILGDTIGSATITYSYRNDNAGFWDLKAGTYSFTEETEAPACVEQSTAVNVLPEDFNTDDPDFYAVKDGVLNVRMLYIAGGDNTCAEPKSVATINLKYDFFDCGRTNTPTASSNPTSDPTTSFPPTGKPSPGPTPAPSPLPSSATASPTDSPTLMPTVSEAPSLSPSRTGTPTQPSDMPSCPINFFDEDSTETGLTEVECGPGFPATSVCQAIQFDFTNVGKTDFEAAITFKYKGDNTGGYNLFGGTFDFGVLTPRNQECTNQEMTVPVTPANFNGEGDVAYVVKNGVLSVKMVYENNTAANTCELPRNVAIMNLKYAQYDCGRTGMPSVSRPPSAAPSPAPTQSSAMPSCATTSGDTTTPEQGLTVVDCAEGTPPGMVCQGFLFSIPVEPALGPAILTYNYKNANVGSYDLIAGNYNWGTFDHTTGALQCPEASTSISISVAQFNDVSNNQYVTKDGFLNITMIYNNGTSASSCGEDATASINLKHDFLDCGRTGMPTVTPQPTIPEPSSSPTIAPTVTPTQASESPSCPMTFVDVKSEQKGLSVVPCGDLFPPTFVCTAIEFTFNDVEDATGDTTITYNYGGDNSGGYDLMAGSYSFGSEGFTTGTPLCAEQSVPVVIDALRFNSDDDEFFAVKNGVLNVKMLYVANPDIPNTCPSPKSVASINLNYAYNDCGRTGMPTVSSSPTTPSSAPSLAPALTSSMPSCTVESKNEFSEFSSLTEVTCGVGFPDGAVCEEISFEFTDVQDSIGDVTISYIYKGDDKGRYDLFAGTYFFGTEGFVTGDPSCLEQTTAVTVLAADFNGDGDVRFIVQNGVMTVRMVYNAGGTNTCPAPQSVARINLQYDYHDCGSV
jgi:hypothetical protein